MSVCPPWQAEIMGPEKTVIVSQRLGEHVPAVANTHAEIEKLLDEVFSVGCVLYQVLSML